MLAIDDNETMLDYAARKAAKAGVEVQFLEQDMEEFKLPVCMVLSSLADGRLMAWTAFQIKFPVCI